MKQIQRNILDALFPVRCIGCFVFDELLCEHCAHSISFMNQTTVGEGALDQITTIFERSDLLMRLVHEYKFNNLRDVERLLRPHLESIHVEDVLVPIPLHRRRWYERGFNQAEEIASMVGGEVQALLARTRNTPQQSKLAAGERQKNIAGAFSIKKEELPERVILVDDIYTTGATMQEAARLLRRSGVKQVSGLCLFRS